MLAILTFRNKFDKRAKKQTTLWDLYKSLKDLGFSWRQIEFAFRPDGYRANASKSLRAIARQNAFLQPHYRQRISDPAGSQATGVWPPAWKIQSFEDAIAEKNKKAAALPFIEWTLPDDTPDCEDLLRAIDKVLAEYPQKNYLYKFQAHFLGVPFGGDTLLELPADYAKGRGPGILDEMSDVWRSKWAFSHARFDKDKNGSAVLTHCLLGEAYNAPGKEKAIPEPFARLAKSLGEFKAKDVVRRAIYSVSESDDAYAKLTDEQRRELDRAMFVYLIGVERAVYRESTGHDFSIPLPAAEDSKELYAYLVTVSHAVNQAGKQTARSYNIGKMRQTAAKAILEGGFTSFEALEPSPPENERLLADGKRYQQIVEETARNARRHLDEAMAQGKLPHRLERYYFPEGVLRQIGQDESGRWIMESVPNPNSDQITYAPYHQIWVPEDQPVPPSLEALGYRRDTVRAQFEALRKVFLGAYRNPVHAMGHFKKTHIDGVECVVVATGREKFNRRKILGAVFKPLGYEFAKQPQGSVGLYELIKLLSETETLSCVFDFGTWRQTVDCFFAFRGGEDCPPDRKGFRIRLTGWSYASSVDISSEELFVKTIENIGAMASIIEKDHVPQLRRELKALRGDNEPIRAL